MFNLNSMHFFCTRLTSRFAFKQTRTNASVQCAHFPACVETRTEVTLVTVLKDTQTEDQRTPRGVKVGPNFTHNDRMPCKSRLREMATT